VRLPNVTARARSAKPNKKKRLEQRPSRCAPRIFCDEFDGHILERDDLLQRAQAFVAPVEEAVEKGKGAVKQEGGGSDASEMVKKIKAAKAPPSAAAGAGMLSGDMSKYFAFGQSQGEERVKKHKKLKRDDGEEEGGASEKKKKVKA
jgi:hypothetical protein